MNDNASLSLANNLCKATRGRRQSLDGSDGGSSPRQLSELWDGISEEIRRERALPSMSPDHISIRQYSKGLQIFVLDFATRQATPIDVKRSPLESPAKVSTSL